MTDLELYERGWRNVKSNIILGDGRWDYWVNIHHEGVGATRGQAEDFEAHGTMPCKAEFWPAWHEPNEYFLHWCREVAVDKDEADERMRTKT